MIIISNCKTLFVNTISNSSLVFITAKKLFLKPSILTNSFLLKLTSSLSTIYPETKNLLEEKANVTPVQDYYFDRKSANQAVCGRALSWFKRRTSLWQIDHVSEMFDNAVSSKRRIADFRKMSYKVQHLWFRLQS